MSNDNGAQVQNGKIRHVKAENNQAGAAWRKNHFSRSTRDLPLI